MVNHPRGSVVVLSRYVIVLLLAVMMPAIAWPTTPARQTNALFQHASPYLAMHGEDPVHWREWNAQTLAEARKQNKILFVSSGYYSCHWCHVMQRESFRNDKIAAELNAHYIAVKVDREIDSALDARLIDFVEQTQGFAGWPLNVFITPEGYPLTGMVYAPPEQFLAVLKKVSTEWSAAPDKLSMLARKATEELNTVSHNKTSPITAGNVAALVTAFVQQSFQLADEMQGGFGDSNKFPSAPQLQALLAIYAEQPEPRLKKFLNQTLAQMASLGMRDQLSGGFYRYSVDPGWHIPHFEKMLYDNALLARLYLDASTILAEPAYAAVGRDTLDFMLREMSTSQGGFATSLSAVDAQGTEGGYYLWSDADLAKTLNATELTAVKAFWNLTGPAELPAGHHLTQSQSVEALAKQLAITPAELTKRIQSARQKMQLVRQQRQLPKDSKRLAAWNGLALSAFVAGARLFKQDKYQQAAAGIVADLRQQWWDSKRQILYRLVDKKKSLGDGSLEDYAYLAQGMYDYWQWRDTEPDRVLLDDLLTQAWQRFYSGDGWLLAQGSLLRYGDRELQIKDGVMPSPSATLVAVSLRYGKKPFTEQARRALLQGGADIEAQAFWHATLIRNLLLVQL